MEDGDCNLLWSFTDGPILVKPAWTSTGRATLATEVDRHQCSSRHYSSLGCDAVFDSDIPSMVTASNIDRDSRTKVIETVDTNSRKVVDREKLSLNRKKTHVR